MYLGRQHIAQQLIAVVLAARTRQFAEPKDLAEIGIEQHAFECAAFERTFSELGFDEQIAELHINLGTIKFLVDEGHACAPAEDWDGMLLQSE